MPHPDCPASGVREVVVEVSGGRDDVRLVYRVIGERVRMPERATPARADGLWRTTCFELFLRFDDDERYVEFNFSPSTQWAAYAFDGYREGMAELAVAAAPRVEPLGDGVAVALDLSDLPYGELAMALSALVEEEGGTKSYWALAHADGPPDFHNPACFVARLPAPGGA